MSWPFTAFLLVLAYGRQLECSPCSVKRVRDTCWTSRVPRVGRRLVTRLVLTWRAARVVSNP